jgi:E3 ubiquitin-protein ligase SHPRH
MHETSVYLYVTAGTVEESIYNLSVKRRMEHMGRQKQQHRPYGTDEDGNWGKSGDATPDLQMLDPSRLDAANTLELEQAALTKLMSKDRTAGELVDSGDLWECLFGHVAGSARPQASNST